MSIFDLLANSSFPDDQLRNLGDEARDRREWDKAAAFYQQYIETMPESSAIWVQLGHAYKEIRQLDLAERSYLRALSIDPLNPDTHLQLGHIEKLRGDSFQAMAQYRKALSISPEFVPAIRECEDLGAQGDLPHASTASAASREPAGGWNAWREEVMGRFEAMAVSIETLNAKSLETEELTSIVGNHGVLLKVLPGKEIVGRLDALTASIDVLNTKVLEMEKVKQIVSKHDVLFQDLPGKEIVGRLDALTGLMTTLNVKILEVENLAVFGRKRRK